MQAARDLIERVGGTTALHQFNKLQTVGFPSDMQPYIAQMVSTRDTPVGSKRKSVPGSRERIRTWAKFGDEFSELKLVAMKLLSCHATSAATERNRSLWGRLYGSARLSLGLV
jgi:hypothetical protein